MMLQLPVEKLLLLAILTTWASNVSSSTSAERWHDFDKSSHRPDIPSTLVGRNFESPTIKDNEITTEAEKKVSHRLIGGHLRVTTGRTPDESFWDDGILLSSAGNGKEKPTRRDEDDEKKTLSQQVKEGKYGLIQNEIYGKTPKRPGIISYLGNPEVPKDTRNNLGGLDEDEIWLAENHVLVLRGGKFPEHEEAQGSGNGAQFWPPIDNYKAPKRQVKIPSKPKVPPPFPIQLTEGGPIQLIGRNGTKETINSTYYKKNPLFTKGLIPENGPPVPGIANGTVETSNNSTNNFPENNEKDKYDELPPGSFPPFYHAIPPGAVFVPPPSNDSDYDEEDQSIYYPPPYSFQYQQDNTTAVPPGPLVPGIVLPPPPDFFSPLEKNEISTKKYEKRPGTSSLPKHRPTYLPPRKLNGKYQSPTTTVPTTIPRSPVKYRSPVNFPSHMKMFNRSYQSNSIETTARSMPKAVTVPYVEITTTTPEESTTLQKEEFYTLNPLTETQGTSEENQIREKNQARPELLSNETFPTMPYYSPLSQPALKKPVEVTPASIKSIFTTGNPVRGQSQASYFFYEESTEQAPHTTANSPPYYYKTTTESSVYETATAHEGKRKPYNSVESVPSRETSKDFNIKFIGPKNSEPVRYGHASVTQSSVKYERLQGQRMLPDHAPLYYQTVSAGPAVQSYYDTAKPQQTYYRQEAKSKPIYQYSFEAADYSRHGNLRKQYEPEEQTNVYKDYRNGEIAGNFNGYRYEYENNQPLPQKRIRPDVYRSRVYPSTSANLVISTTANPNQVHYTHQDERLLDDVTKEYFTIFGKKLPHKVLPSTTPLYSTSSSVTNRPDNNVYDSPESPHLYKTPNVKVHYGDLSQRPYSLKDDTLVNFKHPLPPINPDSEFVTVINHNERSPNYEIPNRENLPLTSIRTHSSQQLLSQKPGPSNKYVPVAESLEELDEPYPRLPISLADDIKVNYRDPRPTINPDAEFIDPVLVLGRQSENPKAYFAYKLPGDGGHFYFLTPQAITPRPEQSVDQLYAKSRGAGLLGRQRRPRKV